VSGSGCLIWDTLLVFAGSTWMNKITNIKTFCYINLYISVNVWYFNVCDSYLWFLLQINPTQLPFTVRGPVKTPPIKGYDSPDGEYSDVSKKW
jgi:predicted membrane-bound dolichyl-phosphate-mannose-protein mannosyltransferase